MRVQLISISFYMPSPYVDSEGLKQFFVLMPKVQRYYTQRKYIGFTIFLLYYTLCARKGGHNSELGGPKTKYLQIHIMDGAAGGTK